MRGDLAPGPFLDLLLEHGHHLDAIRFLAQALVKRAAVWWALQCVTEISGTSCRRPRPRPSRRPGPGCSTPATTPPRVLAGGGGCRDRLSGWLYRHGRILQRREPLTPNLPAVPPGEEFMAAWPPAP